MTNSHLAYPSFFIIGFVGFVVCLVYSQIAINRWRDANGNAPQPPSAGKSGNRDYNVRLHAALPPELRTRIQGARWIGVALLCSGFAFAAIGTP